MASIASVIFIVEVAGVGSMRGIVVEEEMAETDRGEAGFGKFGKDGGGVVDVRAEREGVEEFDVIVIGESRHSVGGGAGRVEAGFGDEGGDDAGATSGEDAEKRIFGSRELGRFEVETARGAGFESFAVLAGFARK